MSDVPGDFPNGPLLSEEEQQLVENFRGIGGRPIRPLNVYEVLGRPTAGLRRTVTDFLHPAMLNHPLVAAFNTPRLVQSDSSQYWCEACTTQVPARQRDWDMHAAGMVHKWQLLSLHETGELAHKHGDREMMSM